MVANPVRRTAITDAALELLGGEGARAVTHRAVDRAAQVPPGTAVNYFPSRADLFEGMAHRIFALLQPDPTRLESLAHLPADQAGPEYAAYVTERLLERPNLARALIELRLEASRNPEVGEPVASFLRAGLDADTDFHLSRGLSGGREHVIRLHHLVNGTVLDAVTTPLDPDLDPIGQTRAAAAALQQ